MWRFWTCWAGWCLSFPAAGRTENLLSSSWTSPPKLMTPVANSTLYVALPGPYQCPSIRGKDYTGRHSAQHHLPPPTAGIKGKVPEETGGRYPSPTAIGVHGQSWFQPDYQHPGNGALCVMFTLSKTQMETGTLSRITKLGGIPLSFFFSLSSFTI